MRKFLLLFAALFAVPAFAQFPTTATPPYGAPPYQSTLASVGFQAYGKTSTVAASGTSAQIALAVTAQPTTQIQVYNAATTAAFVVFCASATCTASAGSAGTSTADYPIGPGAVIVVTVPTGTTNVGVILVSGSGTVYFTPGAGL